MLLKQIALLSESAKVTAAELAKVSAALQKQVMRDFAPIWNIQATVDPFFSDDDVPAGYWKIKVMDHIPGRNVPGLHLDEKGQPYANITWAPDWSLTASHECLEMLVDPFAHQIATGPSPVPKQDRRVNFLVEVCDPCESPRFAYTINSATPNQVLVSDFYTPDYFSPTTASGVLYSFRGNITAPRQVLDGGYISWQDPTDDHIWQLFGPALMKQFVDHGKSGKLNRLNTDILARNYRAKNKATPPPLTGAVLTGAAPANNCNLMYDVQHTGNWLGTAGNTTTITIQFDSGTAKFPSVYYNDASIGSDTSSVTFPIVAGSKSLDFTYASSIPGEMLTIVDPCGNLLAIFPNGDGWPIHKLVVA